MRYKLIPSLLISLGIISLFSYIFSNEFNDNIYISIIYLLNSFVAVLLGFKLVNTIGTKGTKGKIYLFLVISVLLWFLGDLIWEIYTLQGLDPFPSYIDILYLLAYPLFFIAFWKEYKSNQIIWTAKKILTSIFTATSLTLLTTYYGIYMAYDIEATFWENTFSIFYGVADLVLIFILILVLVIVSSYQKGKFFLVWTYFLLAMLFTIIADVLYALYYNEYEEGIKLFRHIDLLWIVSFLFFAQGFNRAREIILETQKNILNKK